MSNTAPSPFARLAAWLKSLSGRDRHRVSADPMAPRDFEAERETGRTAQMSAEDQRWEAETRERERIAKDAPRENPET